MTRTPAESAWLKATRVLYHHLKAPKNGPLKLTLPQFRLYLDKHPDKILDRVWRCAHCRCLLHIDKVSIDHKTPVSMRGPNAPGNWDVVCKQDQQRKQDLGDVQYAMLRALVEAWPREMAASLWRRLSAKPVWIGAKARERVRVVRRRVA